MIIKSPFSSDLIRGTVGAEVRYYAERKDDVGDQADGQTDRCRWR